MIVPLFKNESNICKFPKCLADDIKRQVPEQRKIEEERFKKKIKKTVCKTKSKSLMNLKGARAGNNSLPNKGPYKRKDSASFSPGDRCFVITQKEKQIDMIFRTNPVP